MFSQLCQILYLVAVTALKFAISTLISCVIEQIKAVLRQHPNLSACLILLIGVTALVMIVLLGCSGASGDCTIKTVALSVTNFLSLFLA